MISIITAVYNQLAANRIFVDALRRYTSQPYELIIIDNGSTDGSAEFFEASGARVIRNQANYSYPYCQNQGIAIARYDYLAFLNNDIVVCPSWDAKLVASMRAHGLEAITSCGIENSGSRARTRAMRRRWRLIKGVLGRFGYAESNLRRMHRLMYRPDWEHFSADWSRRHALQIQEGFVGNTVMLHRSALAKIGLWDERIQGADFDLYLRCKTRERDVGDIRPVHIALDVFHHHYIRLTANMAYPPYADRDRLISIEQKWSPDDLALLAQAAPAR